MRRTYGAINMLATPNPNAGDWWQHTHPLLFRLKVVLSQPNYALCVLAQDAGARIGAYLRNFVYAMRSV